MKTAISTAVVCSVLAICLLLYGSPAAVGVGGSLVAAVLLLIVDIVFSAIYKYSLLGELRSLHRVTVYDTEDGAFRATFDAYKDENTINTAIFLGYTADMQSRNLQHFLHDCQITIADLKVLIKHPASIEDHVVVNRTEFSGFPKVAAKIENRSAEVKHSLNELMGLCTKGLVQEWEARGYHGIPSMRAVLINNEYGYLSVYVRHTTDDDLSGTSNFYVRLSKRSAFERRLLDAFLEWFPIAWGCGAPIDA